LAIVGRRRVDAVTVDSVDMKVRREDDASRDDDDMEIDERKLVAG